MKRIGIITLYHDNNNYGGQLQAYALVAVLEKMGFDARQISFDRSQDANPLAQSRAERLKASPVNFFCGVLKRIAGIVRRKLWGQRLDGGIQSLMALRVGAFSEFEASIPHTKVVTGKSIAELNGEFDAFICGSDQVWNPDQLRDAFLLKFVEPGKAKIAYAASIGRDNLTDAEASYIAKAVASFDAVSVREPRAQELLGSGMRQLIGASVQEQFGSGVKMPLGASVQEFKCDCAQESLDADPPLGVEWVLDPTLLLSCYEWETFEETCSVEGPYVFAYLLGDSLEQRKAIKEFALSKGLKVVGLPHILGHYRIVDHHFADVDMYDVSPRQFVSLIKHADYVITDSFHACVLSILYEKLFVVLERKVGSQEQKMNSRVHTLLELFGISERLVHETDIALVEHGYCLSMDEFERLRERSIAFLRKALAG